MAETGVNWGSVADWVSGIGSMSAGIVALYLARASQRIRLRGYCGLRTSVGGGMPTVDLFFISVTNVGTRATVINNISMSIGGWRKKRRAVLTFVRDEHGVGVPVPVADGQQVYWGIPIDTWLQRICDGFVTSESGVKSLRFYVHTNHGESLTLKPEAELRETIRRMLSEAKSMPPPVPPA